MPTRDRLAPQRRLRAFLPLLPILAVTAALSARAAAQALPGPALELAAGALVFPDNATLTEAFVGGAARLYLTPRVSTGPEVAYISGERHSHLMLTGNVAFDLLSSTARPTVTVTPFVVAGGGLFRTRESFPSGDFTSTEGAFTAGGGVRARIGSRVFAGAEARIGWELHLRVNGLVGLRLGR